MSERKVINKYFPADFDPAKIPRRKMGKDRQETVRLMAPFSMRCSTCGEYIYKGKKFNARKETVQNEEYYGIKIFRFYIKCTQCSAEITFKTDPRNTDYAVEHGAARNFEPWRDDEVATTEEKLNRLEEEENNPMQALENKAVDSKREMDILDALQELKTRNARIERAGKNQDGGESSGEKGEKSLDRVNSGMEIGDRQVVKMLSEFEERKKKEAEEDEEEIRKVFGRAYLAGVPDIELAGAVGSSSGSESGEDDSPGTPKDDEVTSSTLDKGKGKGKGKEAAVKRKLDVVEPTPADLLSAASKSIVAKSFGPGSNGSNSGAGGSMNPPVKKKSKGNSAMAKLMGLSFKK